MDNELAKKLWETLKKYRYVIVVLLFGVLLMMLPSSDEKSADIVTEDDAELETDETETSECVERRLQEILSMVDGAGKVQVMLTYEDSGERVIAKDSEISADGEVKESAAIISRGSGTEDTVLIKETRPSFRGAIIAAEGADSAAVCLELTEAAAAVTGLPFSCIKVVKMESGDQR